MEAKTEALLSIKYNERLVKSTSQIARMTKRIMKTGIENLWKTLPLESTNTGERIFTLLGIKVVMERSKITLPKDTEG